MKPQHQTADQINLPQVGKIEITVKPAAQPRRSCQTEMHPDPFKFGKPRRA